MCDAAAITVVLPVRNALAMIDESLRLIAAQHPARIIVVDGDSTDGTAEVAVAHGVEVISDGGRGVAVARSLGAELAVTPWIAFVDVDVRLHRGALASLVEEAEERRLSALQAGLHSVGGPGYWGQALAAHHRSGLSKNWFGLVATVFRREAFVALGLDASFISGEDIELRTRMERRGVRFAVSTSVVVEHRFDDTWEFARGQFEADGAGLARTVVKHGVRALPLLGLPIAAAIRGAVLSIARREPRWVPYYVTFAAFNWWAMVRVLRDRLGLARRRP
jgi:glycosyltransferase involved in cell wall biosynthesis